MTVADHPRQAWEHADQRVIGPASRGGGTWVIHHPGGGTTAPGVDATSTALRRMQNAYLATRGYSLGYNFLVNQDGSSWGCRDMDLNNAANAGKKTSSNFNAKSKSIQIMATGEPASPAAVAEINRIIATQPTWDVVPHMDVDYTACCGSTVAQVRAGIIGQQGATTPELPPPPPPIIDGYNPPENWWLFPIDKNKPPVQEGSTGPHVRYLQDVIFWYAGGDILVDGIFGSATKKRVIDVQIVVGGFPEAYCDGIVGNHATYPTWEDCFDFLVKLNMAPPPVEPPPASDDVELIVPGKYMINQGDNPWTVSATVYGKSTADNAALLDQSAFYMFSTPGHPAFVDTPGVNGVKTVVQGGEGAWDVIRRMVPGVTDSVIKNTVHPIFADWNGGWERVLHPGDAVHLPAS